MKELQKGDRLIVICDVGFNDGHYYEHYCNSCKRWIELEVCEHNKYYSHVGEITNILYMFNKIDSCFACDLDKKKYAYYDNVIERHLKTGKMILI